MLESISVSADGMTLDGLRNLRCVGKSA